MLLEPVAGTALALLCLATASGCNHLQSAYASASVSASGAAGTGLTVTSAAAAVHVICWALQFLGHGQLEGRAPALLDNLFQAIFLAPLFVWMEILFSLGYRPELRARTARRVEEEIRRWKEGKAKAENGKAQ